MCALTKLKQAGGAGDGGASREFSPVIPIPSIRALTLSRANAKFARERLEHL